MKQSLPERKDYCTTYFISPEGKWIYKNENSSQTYNLLGFDKSSLVGINSKDENIQNKQRR